MLKIFIFLFPIIINFLGGGMAFITANRFSEINADKIYVSSTQGVWAISYFLTSLLLGKLITEKRVVPFILSAALLISLFSIGFIVIDGVYFQFVWIFLYGIAQALYCAPFQVFMKRIGGGSKGVVYSTAMYTWAWSFGCAVGPFMFGLIPTWQAGFVLNAIMGFFLAALILWTNHLLAVRDRTQNSATGNAAAVATANPYEGRPDLAWLGWLGLFVGLSVLSAVKVLQQDLLNSMGIDRSHSGPMLALLSAVQAFSALCVIRTKTFFYKPMPCIIAGIIGTVSLAVMSFTQSLAVFYIITATYGIYTSYFYFMLVFHAIVHPTKSGKYAALNETFVGIIIITSSPILGIIAQTFSVNFVLAAGAALTALVTMIQAPILYKTYRNFNRNVL